MAKLNLSVQFASTALSCLLCQCDAWECSTYKKVDRQSLNQFDDRDSCFHSAFS